MGKLARYLFHTKRTQNGAQRQSEECGEII